MKRLFKDKKGSSLVLVLISMTFMTLLGLTIMAMTITNIRLKASQKRTQENFYDTDSVMEAISAGVQDISSNASAEAYATALTEYSASLTGAASLDEKYSAAYLKNMVKALTGSTWVDGTTSYTYPDSMIKGFLNTAQKTAYLGHPATSDLGTLLVDGNSLVMKDLKVYVDNNSYDTTISSDIRITVPSVDTEAHSEYLSYAILADDQIIANALTGATTTILGNLYAGTVNRDTSNDVNGVVISSGSNVEIKAEKVITRGDVVVSDGSSLDLSGNGVSDATVWAENIRTDGTTGNTLNLSGDFNVADDMELNAPNDNVKLTGHYYGYNYNDDYSAANINNHALNASYSSAISINGKSDILNIEGLNNLVLAGRTFISKKTSEDLRDDAGATAVNPDIELGESLAVKSSQLAYFVPGEFIVSPGTGSVVTASKGLPYVDYTDDEGNTKEYVSFSVKDPESTSNVSYLFDYKGYNDYLAITGFNIMDYVDASHPMQCYFRHDTTVTSTIIKYFYLKFADQDKSSAFYEKYYNESVQEALLDSVNKEYLGNDGIRIDNNTVFTTSGTIMYTDQASANKDLKLQLKNNATSVSSAFAKYAQDKSRQYASYQLSLLSDYADVTTDNIWRLSDDKNQKYSKSGKTAHTNLFSKLIPNTDTFPVNGLPQSKYGGVLYLTKGDATWTAADTSSFGNRGIIIAAGDVTLQDSFNGLIISGGDVKITSTGITVKADEDIVTQMFEQDKAGSQLFYNMLSKYFRKSVEATIGDSGSGTAENVTYENWKKNK